MEGCHGRGAGGRLGLGAGVLFRLTTDLLAQHIIQLEQDDGRDDGEDDDLYLGRDHGRSLMGAGGE
jgi:hypothetical protein